MSQQLNEFVMRHSLLPWRLFDTNVGAPVTQVAYGVFCVATGMVELGDDMLDM